MHLIGRWEKVRGLAATGEVGVPYFLYRKWGRLLPTGNEEWWRSPEGLWIPAIHGGAWSGATFAPQVAVGDYFSTSAPSQLTLALSSAYTFNSAGAGMGQRVMGLGKTLAKIYFYLTASAGTAVNVNDINFELRNATATTVLPSTTLHTSGSMDPNGDATFIGWHQINPADFAMVAGTYYWFIIADADGDVTDFATVLTALGDTSFTDMMRQLYSSWTTANGFIADAIVSSAYAHVIEYTDGTVSGRGLGTSAAPSSTTNRKGLRVDAFTEQIKIYGAQFSSGASTLAGFEVYLDDGTVPGGTTQASSTSILFTRTGGRVGAYLTSPYTIPKATALRFVFTFSAGAIAPQALQVGNANGHGTILNAARFGGAGWYYAEANGTTDWTNDVTTSVPQMQLLLDDQVAIAAGGGGLRLAGHGGLAA